jgi:DNA-binding SARP family transcriptional activator/TolB-like protein/Flp pilus assembly protein TadD
VIELTTLGGVDLRDADGRPVHSVLQQPKRMALLVYLAMSSHRFERRDTLLALFWPETSETSARHSLSQAVYKLRDSLGPDAIHTRGDNEIALAPEAIRCDAVAFCDTQKEGRSTDALHLYKGDFLKAFHLDGLREFDRWAEGIRADLRTKAADASWSAANDYLANGATTDAIRTATRALELAPEGELSARAFLAALIASHQHAAALIFYDHLAHVLREELDASPSIETASLAQAARRAGSIPTELAKAVVPAAAPTAPAKGDEIRTAGTVPRVRSLKLPRPFLAGLAVVGAVTAIGWIAWDVSRVPARGASIAVLPFENLTRDTGQDYFAEGIYGAVIAELGGVSALRVTPSGSTVRYTPATPLAEIARDLGVDAVLTGGVERHADSVTIVVHLWGMRPQREIWSNSYNRAVRDVLSIHADIARSVATEVEVRLSPHDPTRPSHTRVVNPAAYDALLQAAFHARRRSGADLTQCFRSARAAVAADPTYAPAYEVLAECYNLSTFVNSSAPAEMFEGSKRAARRAIALDPDLAPAYAALGYAQAHYDWDWAGAERSYRHALELNPSLETAEQDLAWLLSWSGKFEEALSHARRAERLDPFSPQAALRVAMIDNFTHQYDEAIAESHRALGLDSTYMFAYDRLHWAYFGLHQPGPALSAARRASELSGPNDIRRRAFLAHAYAYAGQPQEAERILAEVLKLQDEVYVSPGSIALIYAALGRKTEALAWLERGFEGRDGDMVLLKVFDVWDPLRSEPRFQRILTLMHFVN